MKIILDKETVAGVLCSHAEGKVTHERFNRATPQEDGSYVLSFDPPAQQVKPAGFWGRVRARVWA